jgi:hypothetical protein
MRTEQVSVLRPEPVERAVVPRELAEGTSAAGQEEAA